MSVSKNVSDQDRQLMKLPHAMKIVISKALSRAFSSANTPEAATSNLSKVIGLRTIGLSAGLQFFQNFFQQAFYPA